MRLFYVENINWTANTGEDADPQESLGLELGHKIEPKKLYFSTDFEVQFILRALQKYADASLLKILTQQQIQKIVSKKPFPVSLGNPDVEENVLSFENFLKKPVSRETIRLGVISPYGRNLGDTLMFFTIIKQYKKIASKLGKEIDIHLANAVLTQDVRPVYEETKLFKTINEFPCKLDWFEYVDAYVDFIRPHLRYDTPWVDSLFELSGINAESIPDEDKRNAFILNENDFLEKAWKELKSKVDKPIIIFHRQSTTDIRTMTADTYFRLLQEFFGISDYHFVSLTPVRFNHPRFSDLSHLSKDFNCYIKLISLADGFISVDTSLYHFADAFNVPGVTIYTSQPPDRFSKYYPLVKGFQIEGGEKLNLKHWSNDLEDIKYCDNLWKKLDSKVLIDYLNEMRDKKLLETQ